MSFAQLMQAAITWSEEEEAQTPSSARNSFHSKGVVNVAAGTGDSTSQLMMEMLHEAIKKIAIRQDELFQIVHSKERVTPQVGENKVKTYTCSKSGHRLHYILFGRCFYTKRRTKVIQQPNTPDKVHFT